MSTVTENFISFLQNRSLEEYIAALFAIFVGGSSFYNTKVSRRVEKGIKKLTCIQDYNKNRKKIAKHLKECNICLADESIDIGLTNVVFMISGVEKIRMYPNIFNKREKLRIFILTKMLTVKDGEKYTYNRRLKISRHFNYFIERLEKGEEII